MSTETAVPGSAASLAGADGCIARPVLELAGVRKTYPGRPPVPALDGIDLAIRQGELLTIVGPSGSGKSTLLNVMGTLDRPDSGSVKIAGRNTARLTDSQLAAVRAHQIGFVFQQFFLAEHATVVSNVADGLLYTGTSTGERRRQAMHALHRVGLGHRAGARPPELSGGQRQRVAIARALIGRPAIVLADEPTGNLDSITGRSIVALMEELNADGATIVIITHDHAVARCMPRQVEMLDGRIVRDTQRRTRP